MFKIVKKDLLAARWLLLGGLALGGLSLLQPFLDAGILVMAGMAVVLTGLTAVFFLEDRNKTEIFTLSLPLRKSTVVKARFLLGCLLFLAAAFLIFGVIVPLRMIASPEESPRLLASAYSVDAIFLLLVFSSVFAALLLVLYHRYGFGRGMTVFLLAGVPLMASFVALLAIVPGKASSPAGPGDLIIGSVKALRTALGTPLFLAAAAVLAVVPFVVSLRLSQKFYARREF